MDTSLFFVSSHVKAGVLRAVQTGVRTSQLRLHRGCLALRAVPTGVRTSQLRLHRGFPALRAVPTGVGTSWLHWHPTGRAHNS